MNHRLLKIKEIGDFYLRRTKPQIILSGRWLAQAGFPPGQHVHVDIQSGRLVITLWNCHRVTIANGDSHEPTTR